MTKYGISAILALVLWMTLILFQAPILFITTFPLLVFLFWFGMSLCIKCNFFLPSISQTKKDNILLTFDDGPDITKTEKILDILLKHNAKAMFFLIGNKVIGNEKILERMKSEGHTIGNHSFSHSNSTGFYSTKMIKSDLQKAQEVLGNPTFFRPPFGVTNPNIARSVKQLNLKSVGWTIRSLDTQIKDDQKLLERILKKVNSNGEVVLLHDTQEVTLRILEPLIIELKKRNFSFQVEIE